MGLYREYMMEKCDKLRKTLEEVTQANPELFDMLAEYRKWFDSRDVGSEGEDGWPMDFVFDEDNILAFAEDWNS